MPGADGGIRYLAISAAPDNAKIHNKRARLARASTTPSLHMRSLVDQVNTVCLWTCSRSSWWPQSVCAHWVGGHVFTIRV